MSDNIWIAIIAAVPPTLAAIAAMWQVQRLSRPVKETNAAVNHRAPGQKRLIEVVEDIRAEVGEVREQLEQHRAWHALVMEEDPGADQPF